jgi:hypothetical protein
MGGILNVSTLEILPNALIELLHDPRVHLRADSGRLQVRVTDGGELDGTTRELIRAHRDTLVACVQARSEAVNPAPQTQVDALETSTQPVVVVTLPERYTRNLGWQAVPFLKLGNPLEVGPPGHFAGTPIAGLTKIGAVTRLKTWQGTLDGVILAVAGIGWPRWEKVGPCHDLPSLCPLARPPLRERLGLEFPRSRRTP